jgi:hypothetical protein
MPVEKYNRYFGGKRGSAAKAKAAMAKQYGSDRVFYAMVNKRKGLMKRHKKRTLKALHAVLKGFRSR